MADVPEDMVAMRTPTINLSEEAVAALEAAAKTEPSFWVGVLEKQLIGMAVAGCTCNTKSPTLEFHDTRCMYRLASEALDTVDELRTSLSKGGE